MQEILFTMATFLLVFVAESRVLYSNPNDGVMSDSADVRYRTGKGNSTVLSASKSYNEVNSSPWGVSNLLGADVDNRDQTTEFGQILYSLQDLSTELKVL